MQPAAQISDVVVKAQISLEVELQQPLANMSEDPRSQINMNLKKLQNQRLEEKHMKLINFGTKNKGKTFKEGFEDKDWLLWLSTRTTSMSADQKEFMNYVDERLSNELQMSELEAQDHDAEGWTPISGNGQSAASSSQTGTEARVHHLEEQVKQMASSLDQVTKQLREMHLPK